MFEYDDLQRAINRQRQAAASVVVFLVIVAVLIVVTLVACATPRGGDMSEAEARAVVGVLRATQE